MRTGGAGGNKGIQCMGVVYMDYLPLFPANRYLVRMGKAYGLGQEVHVIGMRKK